MVDFPVGFQVSLILFGNQDLEWLRIDFGDSVCQCVLRMTKPFSLRLETGALGRLERLARRRGLPPATIGAAYVDEGTRMDLHPGVEFRSTPAGRTAFVRGTRLQVWMALDAIRDFGTVEKAARALRIPALLVAGAQNYGLDFPEEIAACREEGQRPLEEIARLVPNHSFLP